VSQFGFGTGIRLGSSLGTDPDARIAAKREGRTSLAFFGSLWGLFRKPNKGQQHKGRGAVTEWEDSDGEGLLNRLDGQYRC
jgi:hypothetical protein